MDSETNMETLAIPDVSFPVHWFLLDRWLFGLTVEMALTMPLVIWSCLICFTTSNWAALCLGMIWSAIFFSSELNFLNRSSNSRDRSLRNAETKRYNLIPWNEYKKNTYMQHNTTSHICILVINNLQNYHINRKKKDRQWMTSSPVFRIASGAFSFFINFISF